MQNRQKLFARYYAETHNGEQSAVKAGYSDKGLSACVNRLLRNTVVRSLIERYEAEILDTNIAKIEERKTILSQIFRAKLGDFVDLEEQTCPHCAKPLVLGKLILDPDRLSAAVQSITQITDKQGNVRHTIKLRDPVAAMHELNLMEGVHKPQVQGDTGELTADQIFEAVRKLEESKAGTGTPGHS